MISVWCYNSLVPWQCTITSSIRHNYVTWKEPVLNRASWRMSKHRQGFSPSPSIREPSTTSIPKMASPAQSTDFSPVQFTDSSDEDSL